VLGKHQTVLVIGTGVLGSRAGMRIRGAAVRVNVAFCSTAPAVCSTRPRTEAPVRYSLAELAAAAGISPHVVRHHIRRGFVPHARGHADLSYYDEEHLHRVLAVQALRKVHKVRLENIGAVLARADAREIRRLAGIPEPPAPPEAPPPAVAPVALPTPDGPGLWQRFPLAPGVELHVRIDLGGDVLTKVQAFQRAWSQATG
jgi:DNA-binding transcriptional MerR regulator